MGETFQNSNVNIWIFDLSARGSVKVAAGLTRQNEDSKKYFDSNGKSVERKRERARINSARYRAKHCPTDELFLSLVIKNDESSKNECENST